MTRVLWSEHAMSAGQKVLALINAGVRGGADRQTRSKGKPSLSPDRCGWRPIGAGARVVVRFAMPIVAVLVLGLGGCGGDTHAASTAPRETKAAKAETATKAPGADGGTGYTLEVPDGWADRTKDFSGSAVRVDRVYAGERADGFTTNVVIVRELSHGRPTLNSVMAVFRQQVKLLADERGIGPIEDWTVGGQPARTYTYTLRRPDQRAVRQRQVIAVRQSAIYTITLSVATSAFAREDAKLAEALASWRWT